MSGGSDRSSPRAESFRTSDLGEAEAFARRVYPRVSLRESRRPFAYEQTVRGVDGISLVRFKISSRIDIAVDFHDVAAHALLLGGRYSAKSRGEDVDTSQPFVFRPGEGSSSSEELDVLTANIDTAVLGRAVSAHLGVDDARIDVTRTAAVSPELRQHWLRTMSYAWRSTQVPEVFHNDLARAVTMESLVAGALATFPVDVLHAGRRPSDAALSSAVRRARTYIEDHADQPLTVQQIAAAARLSVRALQNSFRRELQATPLEYVRRVRLIHARDDLLQAHVGEHSVAEIAARWGFVSASRFAAQYAELFGEKPSVTLRR
ncbi:helix-turn-helix domain-containing protein [Microbacterium aureliae]